MLRVSVITWSCRVLVWSCSCPCVTCHYVSGQSRMTLCTCCQCARPLCQCPLLFFFTVQWYILYTYIYIYTYNNRLRVKITRNLQRRIVALRDKQQWRLLICSLPNSTCFTNNGTLFFDFFLDFFDFFGDFCKREKYSTKLSLLPPLVSSPLLFLSSLLYPLFFSSPLLSV